MQLALSFSFLDVVFLENPSAFALDLFGFDVYPFRRVAAGALSFHDPLEGTETSYEIEAMLQRDYLLPHTTSLYGQVHALLASLIWLAIHCFMDSNYNQDYV